MNTSIAIGILIAIIILSIWCYWAYTIYRWSSDRIAIKIINKYILDPNREQFDTSTHQLSVKNIQIDNNKKIIFADIIIEQKSDKAPIKTINKTYFVSHNYNECQNNKYNCIWL